MVNKSYRSTNISWEEDFNPDDDHRVSTLITHTITAGLNQLTEGHKRLYFIVPTPAPYPVAEQEMLRDINVDRDKKTEIDSIFRVAKLINGATCYITSGENNFCRVIPLAFRLGPPELTLIAANCGFSIDSTIKEISEFVLAALNADLSSGFNFNGMHFDSGDLIEKF